MSKGVAFEGPVLYGRSRPLKGLANVEGHYPIMEVPHVYDLVTKSHLRGHGVSLRVHPLMERVRLIRAHPLMERVRPLRAHPMMERPFPIERVPFIQWSWNGSAHD